LQVKILETEETCLLHDAVFFATTIKVHKLYFTNANVSDSLTALLRFVLSESMLQLPLSVIRERRRHRDAKMLVTEMRMLLLIESSSNNISSSSSSSSQGEGFGSIANDCGLVACVASLGHYARPGSRHHYDVR